VDGQSLDYTITEFPVFSFILGDLHPHVMSLPFLVLALSLGLNLFRSPDPLGPAWLRRHPLESAAIALSIGSLGFINTWDLPLMAGVLAALALAKSYGEQHGNLQRAAMNTVVVLAPILAAAVVLFLPFYLTPDRVGASGVLPLREVSTRPFLFFLVMGLFTFLGISFLLRQLSGLARPAKDDAPAAVMALVIALTPLLVWGMIVLAWTLASDGTAAAFGKVGSRMWVLAGLAIVSFAAFSAAQRVRLGREPVAAFALVLLAAGFYLLAGAELFYVVDFFGGAYRRMNTVFKLYYQAWLLLALAAVYGLYYWQSHRPRGRTQSGRRPPRRAAVFRAGHYAWAGLVAGLLVASLYYPVGAVLDRTGVLSRNHTLKDNTLNGLEFLREANPGEYAAIQWLRDRAPWGRIVEAVGADYSDYGRISSSTGLPTVLGWKGHELQWRGSSKLFSGREEDVAQIYRSDDPERVRQLLEWYDVRYVYFGHRERAAYGGANLAAFGSFLRTAFEQDGVVIYELADGTGQRIAADDGRDPG
jgi:YYY domain-containing protein